MKPAGGERAQVLRRMLDRDPDDPRLRFALALEHLKDGQLEEGVSELRAYLSSTEDEGNAWGRLGAALRELGRDEEAREAYQEGVAAAYRHGHPTMAEEFEEILADWG